LIAPAAQLEYVQDQRLQLELAVRCTVLSLVAAVVTVIFMCWHGWWALLALVPYTLAYLSYRGAIVLANSYGTAVAVVVELNRFSLYEQMRLPAPEDTAHERRQNAEMMKAFEHDPDVVLRYDPAPSPCGSGDDTSGATPPGAGQG
jgi:hypothetical protein